MNRFIVEHREGVFQFEGYLVETVLSKKVFDERWESFKKSSDVLKVENFLLTIQSIDKNCRLSDLHDMPTYNTYKE